MRWIKKVAGFFLIFLLCLGLTACFDKKEAEQAETEVLQEINQIPEDGIITEEEMKTIAGKEGEFKFCGEGDEFSYVWIYNGRMIKNPQEQNLKVTLEDEKTETVKKAANNASVGMGIHLETMHMAAPATLEITLEEKWDADTVICCKYQNKKVYKMTDAEIADAVNGEKTVTRLRFQVTETGDTYYLVGGKSQEALEKQDQDKNIADDSDDKTNTSEKTDEADSDTDETSSGQTSESTSGSEKQEESQDSSGEVSQENNVHTCTISIECSTILNNWDNLTQSKAEFVPSNGWILYPSEVEFTPGETVFDVLKRVCADTGIHMSSRYTPMYGSYYIEGINQLYEFDCGQKSGWMYRVNGWYPNYGCSSYDVEDGDNIEWKYTCDLGVDIGGGEY
ncbi:DUF4430 domain-containing protein [bacterium]|nr:DUF4430 domain-containing protein [bacterium]MDY3021475.1 DUF4430 domain-containing protein [Oliverpabstia sp.]